MTKIPTSSDLQRTTPQSGKSIAAVPRRQYAGEGQGAQQMAQAVRGVGNELSELGLDFVALDKKRKERENRLQVTKAKAYWQQEDMRARADLSQDQDYKTYGTRYEERMKEAREVALGMVDDEYSSNILAEEFNTDLTRGSVTMLKNSLEKEAEVGRADIEDQYEQILENAKLAETTADKMNILSNLDLVLSAGRKNGYISAEKEEEMLDRGKESFADTMYIALSPEEQLDVLAKEGNNGHWINYIPAERRAALKVAAEKAVKAESEANETDRLKGEAIQEVLSMKGRDMTPEEMQAEAERKYATSDPKKFLYLESRIAVHKAQTEEAEIDAANDTFDKWSKTFTLNKKDETFLSEEGEAEYFTFEDIPSADLEMMNEAQIQNLQALSQEKVLARSAPAYDDRANKNMLMNKVKQAEEGHIRWAEVAKYYGEISASLTVKTREEYDQILMEKSVPARFESEYDANQQLEAKLEYMNINDENINNIKRNMNDWQRRYYEQKGEAPSEKVLQEYVDGLFIRYDAPGLGRDEYVYMDPTVDPRTALSVFSAHKRANNNEEPSEEQMKMYMDQYKREGRVQLVKPKERTIKGGR